MSRTIKDTKSGRATWDAIHSFTSSWGNKPRLGRYFKRLLSRKRRQWWDTHERGRAALESTVNYRAW